MGIHAKGDSEMINKWAGCYVFILIFFFFSANTATQAEEVNDEVQSKTIEDDPEMNCTKSINLTPSQKKRLDSIYNRIYKDYADLIEVYAQAGALPENQIIVRYTMLNNYIKTFYKRGYKWCSEHETDEWEEEWYNSDEDD